MHDKSDRAPLRAKKLLDTSHQGGYIGCFHAHFIRHPVEEHK